jgi:glycosyltransferase involved in cell wall biosynthesis
MISARDIIFISSIEWDFLWQVHQEIAFQFAAAGNRVLYIENTGIRAPALQDAGRVANRLKRWSRTFFSHGIREVLPNIFVTSPLVAPPFGSSLSRFLNRHLLLQAVARTAKQLKFRDPLLWTYLPTDTAVDLIQSLATPASVVVYYCGADFSLLATNVAAYRRAEDALVRMADFVLATCPMLFDRCQQNNSEVHLVPAVVNLNEFQLGSEDEIDKDSTTTRGQRSERWPGPVIGYVGGLHRFVDYRLLTSLARARPQWSFVFVGAQTADVGELATLPNVHLPGQRPHAELARYIREFDVCTVPYLNAEVTATVVPLKINEYLAMGKPIVSTELPTVCDFNNRHQVLVTAPNETEAFLKAIEKALSLPVDAATVNRRREVATLGDSKTVVAAISELIEGRLKAKTSNPTLTRELVLPAVTASS